MRASNGVSEPLAASVDSAPVTSAAWNTRSIANRPASASAVENCVPLSSARPSFGPSTSGASPARASAVVGRHALAAEHAPRRRRASRPSYARAARDRPRRRPSPGPASPGCTSRASMRFEHSDGRSRTPEAPRPRLASFNAIISRTIAGRIGSPTPAACDSTMLRWSAARSSGAMRTLASFPKPVLMP